MEQIFGYFDDLLEWLFKFKVLTLKAWTVACFYDWMGGGRSHKEMTNLMYPKDGESKVSLSF